MKKLVIIFFAFTLLTLPSCKKYEEGPLISLRSPENRIFNGWIVKKVYINNIDSTFDFIDKYGSLFHNSGSAQKHYYSTKNSNGVYELKDNDTKLWFNPDKSDNGTVIYPYNGNESTLWEIKKLKKKELIIEAIVNYKLVRIEYVAHY